MPNTEVSLAMLSAGSFVRTPVDIYTFRFTHVWELPWSEYKRRCEECERLFRPGEETVIAGGRKASNRRRFHTECYLHGAPWRQEMSKAILQHAMDEGVAKGYLERYDGDKYRLTPAGEAYVHTLLGKGGAGA